MLDIEGSAVEAVEPDGLEVLALLVGDCGVTERQQQATRPGCRYAMQAPNGIRKIEGVVEQAFGISDARHRVWEHELSLSPECDFEECSFYRCCASPRFYTAKILSGHSPADFIVTQQFQGLSSVGLAEAGYVPDRNVAIVGQMVTMGSYQT